MNIKNLFYVEKELIKTFSKIENNNLQLFIAELNDNSQSYVITDNNLELIFKLKIENEKFWVKIENFTKDDTGKYQDTSILLDELPNWIKDNFIVG